MSSQALVDEYLRRLERAADRLAPARRGELVGDVKEHIEAALAGDHDELTVRNVLDRLGTPEEIVAAEARPTASIGVSASPAIGPVAAAAGGSWRTPARLVILALSVALATLGAGIVVGGGPGSLVYAVAFAFTSPVVLVLLVVAVLTSRKRH